MSTEDVIHLRLTPDYQFQVVELGITKSSLYEARQEINNAITRSEIEKRASLRISEPMLTDKGDPITLRGISGSTGDILTSNKEYSGPVYPVSFYVMDLLKEKDTLRQRIHEINAILDSVEVKKGWTHSRASAELLESTMERLVARVAEVKRRITAIEKEREGNVVALKKE